MATPLAYLATRPRGSTPTHSAHSTCTSLAARSSVRARDGTASAAAGACAGHPYATSIALPSPPSSQPATRTAQSSSRLAMPWMARSPPTAAALRRGPLPNACAHARDEAVTLGRAVTSGGQMCRHGRAHGAITADPSDSGATRVRAWRAWAGRTRVTISSARSSPSTAATESPDTCEA